LHFDKHHIENHFVLIIKRFGRNLSVSRRRFLGRIIGRIVCILFPYRKKVMLENLTHAFPQRDRRWLKTIASRTYVHFMQVLLDFFPVYALDSIKTEKMFRVVNQELLENSLAQKRGVCLVLFHFGNWEALCHWIAVNGYPVRAIAQKMRNPYVDRLVKESREQYGLTTISPRTSSRDMILQLKQNKLLLIVADQDAKHRGIFIDYFGRPSSTYRGPATLALRAHCPLLIANCLLDERGHYNISFEEISLEYPRGGQESPIHYITQKYTRKFEELIRQHPEQYLWFHRRWKTKPPQS